MVLTSLCLTSLVLVGCGKQHTPTSSNNEVKTVKIWVIAPLSGPAASIWEDTVKVIKYQIDEYNKVATTKIELVMEDGKCSWKDATDAAQKLINVDQVSAILWWVCSAETLAAWVVAEQSQTPLISALSSSPAISSLGDYIYRYFNDEQAAKFVADYFNPRFKKIAMVVENSDYSKWFLEAYKKYFTNEIGNIITYNPNEKDLDIIIKNLSKDNYDWIFFINNSDSIGVSLLTAMKKNWLLTTYQWKIFLAIWWTSQNLIDKFPWELEWLYWYSTEDFSKIWNNTEFIAQFEKNANYKIQFDKTYLLGSAELWDLAISAIKAKAYSREDFKKYLDSINVTNQRKSPFMWSLYFNHDGDAVGLRFALFQIKNNKAESIEVK